MPGKEQCNRIKNYRARRNYNYLVQYLQENLNDRFCMNIQFLKVTGGQNIKNIFPMKCKI